MKSKLYIKGYNNLLIVIFATLVCMGFISCDDNQDKYEITDGIPYIYYVRVPNPESADSLLVKAYMNSTIVLVGDNLTSIREMWFNDKKAILNSSFITRNTLFVNVPNEIPSVVTNRSNVTKNNAQSLTILVFKFQIIR
jgi:hypothetical protein